MFLSLSRTGNVSLLHKFNRPFSFLSYQTPLTLELWKKAIFFPIFNIGSNSQKGPHNVLHNYGQESWSLFWLNTFVGEVKCPSFTQSASLKTELMETDVRMLALIKQLWKRGSWHFHWPGMAAGSLSTFRTSQASRREVKNAERPVKSTASICRRKSCLSYTSLPALH